MGQMPVPQCGDRVLYAVLGPPRMRSQLPATITCDWVPLTMGGGQPLHSPQDD